MIRGESVGNKGGRGCRPEQTMIIRVSSKRSGKGDVGSRVREGKMENSGGSNKRDNSGDSWGNNIKLFII